MNPRANDGASRQRNHYKQLGVTSPKIFLHTELEHSP
jgi:hypothetical protein